MRFSMRRIAIASAVAGSLLGMGSALAHGLLVSVHGEGSSVIGTVYYSDGALAVGEFVQLIDADAPAESPRSTTADGDGNFRFDGATVGHRYRVIAEGEEGHVTEMELVLAEGAKARLNDADGAPAEEEGLPAWLVIGGLLLLSLVPAFLLRRKKA